MARRATILLVSVVLGACTSATRTAPPVVADSAARTSAAAPQGTVGPAEARIVIPVTHAGPWQWNAPVTPENRREYGWEVELADSAGAASPYQFGFSLFKAPGAVRGTGSLAALLAAGQTTVWKRTRPDQGEAQTDAHVRVSALGDSAVLITVTDQATLSRLFAGSPRAGVVVVAMPGEAEQRMPLTLRYVPR